MGNITVVVALTSAFTFIAALFTFCRLYVRWVIRALRWDDFFLTLAMVSSIGATVLIIMTAVRNFLLFSESSARSGRRISDLANFNEASIAVYTMQNMFARLSFLLSFRRFTPRDQRLYQRRTINILLVVVVLGGLLLTYAELFPCYPPHLMTYPYDVTLPKRGFKCLTPRVPFYWSVWFGLAVDVLVYLLPFWTLRDAQISRHHKGVLYMLFAGGGVVLLVGAARIPLVRVYQKHNLTYVSNKLMMAMWILSSAEANGMVVAGSLPLRPLWRHVMWSLQNQGRRDVLEADEEYIVSDAQGVAVVQPDGRMSRWDTARASEETQMEECKEAQK